MSDTELPILSNSLSRRTFLSGAAAAAALSSVAPAGAFGEDNYSYGHRQFAYVGTYPSNGAGIYLYEQNQRSGNLSLVKLASDVANPSFLLASASGNYLYSVNEIGNYLGGSTGSVTAFKVNRQTGDLTPLNTASSGGSGPVFLSLDLTGKFLFVANYGGGNIAVLSVRQDGSLGTPIAVQNDFGNLGPAKATSAPPGSFAVSGHDAPHAHCILVDPSNRYVLQTDLGQDRIYIYSFDARTGSLAPAATPYVPLPPGDGPRHIVFHPNGRWLYSIQEEASTLVLFHFDNSSGKLTQQQTVSSLPPGFAGTSFASELQIGGDGRVLYASNRLNDTITTFRIGYGGELTFAHETATRGDYPRQFQTDPSGRFLYVGNQRSDNVTVFELEGPLGFPRFTGQYVPVGTPACITFLP